MRLQWRLTRLEREEGSGQYLATFDTPEGEQRVKARAVVSTAPAHALKEVLTPVLPEADKLCDEVREDPYGYDQCVSDLYT